MLVKSQTLLFTHLAGPLVLNSFKIAAVNGIEKPPEFKWNDAELSRSGIPLLHLHFPALKSHDVAHLQVSDLVEQPFDRDNHETCIFTGSLEYESDVLVALSGCPGTDRFEVMEETSPLRCLKLILRHSFIDPVLQ